MNIGNQLYSSLSQLARQSFLMQKELPTMQNAFEADYQLHYSESYTGTVHQETTVEEARVHAAMRLYSISRVVPYT